MNLNEATENLKDHTPKSLPYFDPPFVEALKLGIEAMKLVMLLRSLLPPPEALILPGETED